MLGARRQGATASAERSSPAQIVLVVEDDPHVRQVIEWVLEDEDIPYASVGDGRAALDWLAARRPALVLLDIGLPIVDGFGVAEGLRSAHGGDVPIVVMTANTRAAESARRVGARAFLAKPFQLDDLVALLHRSLQGD